MLAGLDSVPDVGAVVVSGDVADDGSPEAYTAARDMVREFAGPRRAPVVFCTGNHDERGAFAKVLGSGHLGADGGDLASAVVDSPDGERAAVSEIGGHRFVTLDSLVPGKVYGRIGPRQLDWLREVLAEPSPHGTVVVLHHPPVTLDVEVQQALGLQDGAALADAVRGTDVRLVLCGHFHLQLFGHLASVPVWVTPGVLSRVDLTGPQGTERGYAGPRRPWSTSAARTPRCSTCSTHATRGRARPSTSSTATSSARSSSDWAPARDVPQATAVTEPDECQSDATLTQAQMSRHIE